MAHLRERDQSYSLSLRLPGELYLRLARRPGNSDNARVKRLITTALELEETREKGFSPEVALRPELAGGDAAVEQLGVGLEGQQIN